MDNRNIRKFYWVFKVNVIDMFKNINVKMENFIRELELIKKNEEINGNFRNLNILV